MKKKQNAERRIRVSYCSVVREVTGLDVEMLLVEDVQVGVICCCQAYKGLQRT